MPKLLHLTGLVLLLGGCCCASISATVVTRVFQQGLDGYAGVKDAELRLRSGTANPPTGPTYMLVTDG